MLRHIFHPSCITLFLPFMSSFSFLFFLTFSLSLILVLSYALMSAHLSRMSTLRDLFEIVVSNYDISTRYLYTYTGWLDRLFPGFCFSFVFFIRPFAVWGRGWLSKGIGRRWLVQSSVFPLRARLRHASMISAASPKARFASFARMVLTAAHFIVNYIIMIILNNFPRLERSD